MHTETHIKRWQAMDIDEQSGMLPDWEQQYRQLGCGKFVGSISTARGPRITIVGESTNQSLHETLVPPDGQLVFGVVLNRDNALQVNRRQVNTTSLLVLEGGREYDFRTTDCTDLLGIVMEREMFYDGMSRNVELVESAIANRVVQLDPSAALMLRHFWLMLSQILQRGDATWPSTMPLTLLADTALNNIWLALNMSQQQGGDTPEQTGERQARVVKQAIRFMCTHLDTPFSIADVCQAAHVSQRTLQYHFESCLQVSPQQYLKALRLNAARSLIRRLGAERQASALPCNIAEIAAQCGYEHPSRFAGDYKRQFGMLPSEALRDCRHVAQ